MNNSFDNLMTRLRERDDAAAKEVFDEFAGRLIALARSRLDSHIRRKVEPEDVVQSAFRSFFTRQADGKFELKNWESLWGLLAQITLRKCGHKIKALTGPTRDVRREVPPPRTDDSDIVWEEVARDPTASQHAILDETLEQLRRGLKEREWQVFVLRLQGYTAMEISEQVGRTEYTVAGILKKIRKQLLKMREQPV
jgi:RNA polymerase sigma-70 factor (ECF subfamily)